MNLFDSWVFDVGGVVIVGVYFFGCIVVIDDVDVFDEGDLGIDDGEFVVQLVQVVVVYVEMFDFGLVKYGLDIGGGQVWQKIGSEIICVKVVYCDIYLDVV